MARKKKHGLKRVEKLGPRYPAVAKLGMKAYGGTLNGPRYAITTQKLGKLDIGVLRAKFAAKKYIELMIADDDVKWVSDTKLVTSTGIELSGNDLRELYDYRYRSLKTEAWELSDFYKQRASYMRSDKPYKVPLSYAPSRKRNSRKGMILIRDICKEIKMHPRDARGILRALDYEKPEKGWAWRTREEADEIKEVLLQSRRKTKHLTKEG